jgi:fumarate reductase flavoprotein subunit
MKKTIALLASLAMAASLAGCGSSTAAGSAGGVSGTFTGTAKGNGGDVTVTLTLKDGKITDAKAEGKDETAGIGSKAIEQMPGEMVSSNSIAVDTVSSATITSKAILEAAKAALESAGVNVDDYMGTSTSAAAAEDLTEDADVVVIGAGGAGMTAAITAADAGRKVIIVESQAVAGGNSVRSTGGMNAAKTTYEDANQFDEAAGVEKTLKAAAEKYADNKTITDLAATVKSQWDAYQAAPTGYFDSVELFELDTMIGGKGINNPELVKTLAENSAPAIDWLKTIGADLTSVGQFGGASVKRIHRPVDADGKVTAVGAYLVPILEDTCKAKNIEILYNTTADKILTDSDGKAVGISATGKSGNAVTINAKAVVVATGGFGANLDMVVKYKPELKGFVTTNAAGAQGQGIDMATAVGAGTVDMDQIQIHPTVHVDADGNAHLITEGLRGDGAILVNNEGKRFTDEVGTRDAVSAAENSQTNGTAWLIIDQKMADASAVIQGYIKSGYTVTGSTYEELAKAMNVDPTVFSATMDTWNSDVAAKADSEFNRTSFAEPLSNAPYYAITVQPGIHHTMGGVTIDTAAEVTKADGTVIPGLFAAGEVTGGVHGANRLGGNAVCDFVVFGRISGASAADYAGK